MYICINNKDLNQLQTEHSWEMDFLGRKIDAEKYYTYFDHNGYYLTGEKYEMSSTVVNLKPIVNKENVIVDISFYKVKYLSEGPGRPVSVEKNLTKAEIKKFCSILKEVTIEDYDERFKAIYCESIEEVEDKYLLLSEAVSKGDEELISENIMYARLVKKNDINSPLLVALRGGNVVLANKLIDAGSYVRDSYLDEEGNVVTALLLALTNCGNELYEKMIRLGAISDRASDYEHITCIFNYLNKKQDIAKIIELNKIIKDTKYIYLPKELKFDLQNTICPMVNSDIRVLWPLEYVKKVFFMDRGICKKMISQGCENACITFFVENDDYEFFKMAVDVSDKKKVDDAYIKLYLMDKKWYSYLSEHTFIPYEGNVVKRQLTYYLTQLIKDGEFKLYSDIVNNLGIQLGGSSIFNGFPHISQCTYSNSEKDSEFWKSVAEHIYYDESNGDNNSASADFYLALEKIYRFGTKNSCEILVQRFHKKIFEDKRYNEMILDILLDRDDDFWKLFLKYQKQYAEGENNKVINLLNRSIDEITCDRTWLPVDEDVKLKYRHVFEYIMELYSLEYLDMLMVSHDKYLGKACSIKEYLNHKEITDEFIWKIIEEKKE